MAGLADFHMNAAGETGRQAQPRAEYFQDERIAHADEFNAAAQADPERFEALGVLVVGLDAAHDGTNVRRQFIKPHQGGGLFKSCHSDGKISFPPGKSTVPRGPVDIGWRNKFFMR
jgi:hypothetical protein